MRRKGWSLLLVGALMQWDRGQTGGKLTEPNCMDVSWHLELMELAHRFYMYAQNKMKF